MFRAPTWSINSDNLWALQVLDEEGFVCDSSMQPFKTPISGMNGMPSYPFHPAINNIRLKILEYPPTVLQLGKIPVPFAGGLYLRLFPYSFISRALRKVNPWELDTKQPRLKVPVHIKASHYLNIDSTSRKLNSLLTDFEFVPLGELIREGTYPSVTLD